MLEGLSSLVGRLEFWICAICLTAFLAFYRVFKSSLDSSLDLIDDSPTSPASRVRVPLALLALGLTMVLGGGLVAATHGIAWSLPFFVTGVGIVLWQNQGRGLGGISEYASRRISDLSHLSLNTMLLAGVLMILNVAAFRYGGQGIDLTRERTFSLSSLTLNQIESLKRPIKFHVIYGGGARSARQLDRIVQLLELYRGANPAMVQVESLNPWTELARGEELTKRAPDLALLRGSGVLIEYGEGDAAEYAVVSSNEMFERTAPEDSLAAPDRFASSFRGEDAITSAIIRLQEGKKFKVAFLTGHGEPSTSETSANGGGIGLWRARLASVGAEPIELNLLTDPISDDLTLLVIAGPRSPIRPDEVAKIKAYSDRGGPLLVMIGGEGATGLEEFLREFNVELSPGLILDPTMNFRNDPKLVFTLLRGSQSHPITASLTGDRAILIPNGAPIRILGQGPAIPGQSTAEPRNPNLVPIIVLRTGPRSWGETDLNASSPRFDQGADTPGPVTVGVAVQQRGTTTSNPSSSAAAEPKPRLVLFSSRSFAENVVQSIEPTNLDLLMNATSWLRGKPDVVGLAANTHVALTLTADPALRGKLVLVPTVLAVLATISVGIIVYLSRRE